MIQGLQCTWAILSFHCTPTRTLTQILPLIFMLPSSFVSNKHRRSTLCSATSCRSQLSKWKCKNCKQIPLCAQYECTYVHQISLTFWQPKASNYDLKIIRLDTLPLLHTTQRHPRPPCNSRRSTRSTPYTWGWAAWWHYEDTWYRRNSRLLCNSNRASSYEKEVTL